MKRRLFPLLILLLISAVLQAQQKAGMVYTTRQTPVHDPVLIKEKGTYYLFCTGWGISVFSSTNLKDWKREKPVFGEPPGWAVKAVPGYKGHTWAPDISYHNGQYYLYYSVSTFGKNRSCIGLAVNKTLDPASPDFCWRDQGMVIQSIPGKNNWNAIDPNLALDERDKPWLVFGSFWSGIQLMPMKDFKTPAADQPRIIANRLQNPGAIDSVEANGAIEGPYIFRKGGNYYLFVSWDYCCRGEKSDYKVVVGRSQNITGPYLDKKGQKMTLNGGSLFIAGDQKEWFGIGHNGIFTDDDGTDYFIAHGYDGYDKGKSKLIIKKMNWDNDGWPYIEGSFQ